MNLKKTGFNFLKISISLIIVYLLFKNVDFNLMLNNLKKVDMLYFFLAAFFFVVVQQIFFILRWMSILHFNGIDISFLKIMKYHYMSILFQTFLPSGIGADAAKAVLTLKYGKKSGAINSVLISRGMGILVLFIFALLGSFFIDDSNNMVLFRCSLIFFVSVIIASGILIRYNRIYNFLMSLKIVSRFKKIKYIVKNFRDNMDWKLLLKMFMYSVLIQSTVLVIFYFMTISLGINIDFLSILTYYPVITILVLVIPTINGIGAREYFMFYFYKDYIKTTDMLGSLSIIGYTLYLITILIGLIFFIYHLIFRKT